MRLERRLIELPQGAGIVAFVQYDGKPPASRIGPVDTLLNIERERRGGNRKASGDF